MAQDKNYRSSFATAAFGALLVAPVLLSSACSQAPADNTAELQAKLAAAEARATAAEKRVKAADDAAGQHYQESLAANAQSQPEMGQPDPQFGQPMNDTAPIDTSPVNTAPVPAQPQSPGTLSN